MFYAFSYIKKMGKWKLAVNFSKLFNGFIGEHFLKPSCNLQLINMFIS